MTTRRVPKLRPGVNVRELELDAGDGFILASIDGKKSAEELASLFGETVSAMEEALDRFAALGAIEFDAAAVAPRGTLPGPGVGKLTETVKPGAGMSVPPQANAPVPQAAPLKPAEGFGIPAGIRRDPVFGGPAPMIVTAKPEGGMSMPPPANPQVAPLKAPQVRLTPAPSPAVTYRPDGNSIPAGPRAPAPAPTPTAEATESILNRPRPPSSANHAAISPEPGSSPGSGPGPAKIPSTPAMRAPYPSFSNEAAEDIEVVELDDAHKARVLELYGMLRDADHYALLGVPKDADKKAIKRAYYEVAASVHPDKHFRRKLGSFKTRMEHVFAKLTEAHDTLTDKDRRAEYDAYMGAVANTARMESMLDGAKAEAERLAKALEDQLRSERPASSDQHPATKPDPASLQSRKDALARRLRGGAPTNTSKGAPPAEFTARPEADSARAIAALKQRYEDRLKDAQAKQIARYVGAAEEALSKNDVVAAAHSLELALGFAPNDATLKARYAELRSKADLALYDGYLTQANYQERANQPAEAAKSWARIVRLRPNDAKANDRAAYNTLKAEGDLHAAAEFGKQAILLEPKNATYRCTLAQIYVAANLPLAAKREAEMAMQLGASDPSVTAVAKRILTALGTTK